MTGSLRPIGAVGLALLLASTFLARPAGAQLDWDSPATAACFESWISETERRLNAYSGDDYFNRVKPWRINRYGLVYNRDHIETFEPDDWWTVYRGNKYHRMWENYSYDEVTGWRSQNWDGAGVPPLRPYVRACLAASGGGGGSAGGGRPPGVYVWVFTDSSPRMVGVADAYWPSGHPAWTTVAGPFPDHPSAWRVACDYHSRPGYNAPAITNGAIDCDELARGISPPSPPTGGGLPPGRSSGSTAGSSSSSGSGSDCDRALGVWKWFNGGEVTLLANGQVRSGGRTVGSWGCRSADVVVIDWGRYRDTLRVSSDGSLLEGESLDTRNDRVGRRGVFGTRLRSASREDEGGPSDCDRAIGRWKWFNGGEVSLLASGAVRSGAATAGSWTCDSAGVVTVDWGRYLDTLTVSGDGQELRGTSYDTRNDRGGRRGWFGRRID